LCRYAAFVLETCDGNSEKRYRQVFSNNMSTTGAPVISKCKKTDNWTCITFKPDLAKFGMTHLEDDTVVGAVQLLNAVDP
jgi:DNA topoisomerase-2